MSLTRAERLDRAEHVGLAHGRWILREWVRRGERAFPKGLSSLPAVAANLAGSFPTTAAWLGEEEQKVAAEAAREIVELAVKVAKSHARRVK